MTQQQRTVECFDAFRLAFSWDVRIRRRCRNDPFDISGLVRHDDSEDDSVSFSDVRSWILPLSLARWTVPFVARSCRYTSVCCRIRYSKSATWACSHDHRAATAARSRAQRQAARWYLLIHWKSCLAHSTAWYLIRKSISSFHSNLFYPTFDLTSLQVVS